MHFGFLLVQHPNDFWQVNKEEKEYRLYFLQRKKKKMFLSNPIHLIWSDAKAIVFRTGWLNWVDLITIVPFAVDVIITSVGVPNDVYRRVTRWFEVLRILKVGRYSTKVHVRGELSYYIFKKWKKKERQKKKKKKEKQRREEKRRDEKKRYRKEEKTKIKKLRKKLNN